MTKDDIPGMAREAGIGWAEGLGGMDDFLERFAQLVAAHEREACAKLCDDRVMGDHNREDAEAERCAASIRARGNA